MHCPIILNEPGVVQASDYSRARLHSITAASNIGLRVSKVKPDDSEVNESLYCWNIKELSNRWSCKIHDELL